MAITGPFISIDPLRGALAELLGEIAPGDLQYSFFINNGTDAVEGAYKLARLYTGRVNFISSIRGFHGKSCGSLSLMGKWEYREPFLPLLPGVSTGSEVMTANADGYMFLKLFPATAVGGITLLKALGGPFPDVAFCPTGGITPQTAPDFLALPNVKVCGGSWLTPDDAVKAGDWARITKLASESGALRR